MTSHSSHASRHHAPTGLLTPGQTLLCFLGGIIAMFMVVSVVFAMKLSAEGRLPSLSKLAKAETVAPPPALKKPAPSNSAVSPPITASAPSRGEQTVEPSLIRPDGNATFVPGTENLLPAEVAHLAKDASPANSAEGRPPTPTATVTVTPAHVESTPPAGVLPRAAAAYAATSSRTPQTTSGNSFPNGPPPGNARMRMPTSSTTPMTSHPPAESPIPHGFGNARNAWAAPARSASRYLIWTSTPRAAM